jgi:hypothetical protein
MQIIPLTAVPSQTLSIVLNQQNCAIKVYTLSTGLFLDLYLEGTLILSAIICRDRVQLVRQPYLGFVGNLAFMDTEGTEDPEYTRLGSRFVLMYLEPDE